MKYFLSLLLIVSCLLGCQKDKVTAPSVVGKWELRQQVGGISGSSTNYTAGNGNIYQFNSDGSFMQYAGGSVTAQGTYTIKANAQTMNSVGYNKIYFNGSSDGTIVQMADSTLTLGLDYDDGVASIYAKL